MSTAVHHFSSHSTLSPQQQQVLHALASGSNITAAAEAAGVHRTTIHHWRRTSGIFAASLLRAREDRALQIREEIQSLAVQAVDTLREILVNPDGSESARLKAALAIINSVSSEHVVNRDISEVMHEYAAPPMPAPPEPSSEALAVPRSAPCPCGSGLKYKRCCGANAPAVLCPASS